MPRTCRLPFALCAMLAVLAPLGPTAAAEAQGAGEPPIELTAAQQRAAGLAVEAVSSSQQGAVAGETAGLRLSGQAVPPGDSIAVMRSTVAGQVESVAVHAGQEVSGGQRLVTVSSAALAEMQREFLHARTEHETARARLERDELLLADGIVPERRVLEARAARDMAAATLQQQRRLLQLAGYDAADLETLKPGSLSSSATVRAGSASVVLDVGVIAGQSVDPGTALVSLMSGDRLWLELHASAQQSGGIGVGDTVTVAGCPDPGRVIAVGSQLSASSQTASVRAELPGATRCLRVNQYVDADVRSDSPPPGSVGVPTAAIVRHADRDFVFVQTGSAFRPVPIRRVRPAGAITWVQGDVAPGAKVVSRGLVALKGAWLGLGPQPAADGSD